MLFTAGKRHNPRSDTQHHNYVDRELTSFKRAHELPVIDDECVSTRSRLSFDITEVSTTLIAFGKLVSSRRLSGLIVWRVRVLPNEILGIGGSEDGESERLTMLGFRSLSGGIRMVDILVDIA
ncbi:hypothetical protein DFJ43DRAFT_1041189 [Lentinula guzmanii]|uniref:Uncharacterized protein n=2 Tax=Lentinula TaxID=5352 RepID=A0AA38JIX9_9AGAR|nr:hypothetical protein DFJ43DRAFT_1041189 [Lentinula guzmanii]KAJ3743281.1 hypothetical protein DFH05DRAFT_1461408 [Lentinula detonsa]KAJ3751498.1 hypothetical protein DFH05DRAFT_1456299 [Lentinula detonsa]